MPKTSHGERSVPSVVGADTAFTRNDLDQPAGRSRAGS
jgi:hypothetical protein